MTSIRTALAVSFSCLAFFGSGIAAAGDDAAAPDPRFADGRVLVRYLPGTSAAEQGEVERGQDAQRISEIAALGVAVLAVPEGAEARVVTALSRSGKVEYAERDGIAVADAPASSATNDPYLSQQWGLLKIGTPTAWGTTTGSSSVIVAVIDTGADLAHPDLKGRFTAGYDFVNNDRDPSDDQGHGTATSGIVGAATNNSTGIAGMCWTCTLMPIKALNSSGSGSYSTIANAVTWAADNGADVINLSLGGSTDSSTLHSAVTYARNKGIVIVGSAGNNGTTALTYPGSYSEVLSVAGSTSNDGLYSWSTYGSWVKVAAPGCDYTTARGGGYNSSFCGTSAAAPVVSGMVGLMRAANPGATVSQIESAVTSTAVPIGSVVRHGRVDAAAAVAAVATTSPTPETSPEPTPTVSSWTFSGQLNGGNPSRSYAVTTPAGTLSAALTFTRSPSLDLALVSSSGAVVATGSGASPVRLSASVSAGTYTLVVSGGRGTFTLQASTS